MKNKCKRCGEDHRKVAPSQQCLQKQVDELKAEIEQSNKEVFGRGHDVSDLYEEPKEPTLEDKLQAERDELKGLSRDQIKKGLDSLNSAAISIIKDGIEQSGKIGHYGKNFIATKILEQVKKG